MYLKNSILMIATLSLFSGCDINKDENNYYTTPNTDGSEKNSTLNINTVPTEDGTQRVRFNITDENGTRTSDNRTITIRENNVSNRDRVENNSSDNTPSNLNRDKNSSSITPVSPNIKDTSALTTYSDNNISNEIGDKNTSETTTLNLPINDSNISNNNTLENNFSTPTGVNDKNISTTINTPTVENPNSITTMTDEDSACNNEPEIKDNNISEEPISELPDMIDAGKDTNVTVNNSVILIGTGVVKYEWKEGDDVLATTALFNYTPKSIGEHTLTFSITDLDGLVYTDVVTVMANETNSTQK